MNLRKSKILGIRVSRGEVSSMARLLKCHEGELPFYYLGIPVDGKSSNVSNRVPPIDKFQK